MNIVTAVRIAGLLALAAFLQPVAVAGEGGFTARAYPLWTQRFTDERFVIIDTSNSTYRQAPVQMPDGFNRPFTFTYDPARALLWTIAPYKDAVSGQDVPYLGSLDPWSGQLVVYSWLGPMWHLRYLTYRRYDGLLYALQIVPGSPSLVVSIDPHSGEKRAVTQIKPVSLLWRQQYSLNNDPPTQLVFDPLNDHCYYASSPESEMVLFRLDLATGESTLVDGILSSMALAFEPMTHRLYGTDSNWSSYGPPHLIWYADLVAHADGDKIVDGGIPPNETMQGIVQMPPVTAIAFVPDWPGNRD